MPRIPYVEREAASGEMKKLYDNFEAQFQTQGIPNVVKTLANSPDLAVRVFPLANYFIDQITAEPAAARAGRFDFDEAPRLRIWLRTAYQYCREMRNQPGTDRCDRRVQK